MLLYGFQRIISTPWLVSDDEELSITHDYEHYGSWTKFDSLIDNVAVYIFYYNYLHNKYRF